MYRTVRPLAALVLAAAPALGAQTLPRAQDLVDRHVAAIGGQAAIGKHTGYRMKGTFEMPAMGIKGEIDAARGRPNKMLMKMNVPGIGEMLQGFDGTTAWSVDPMQGARVLQGAELEQSREIADFASEFTRASAQVVSRETVERTEMNGQPCYKVKVVKKSGKEDIECYSVETGLLVAAVTKVESAMGAQESTSLIGDYKDFGGVKIATRMRIQGAMGQEQVLTINSIEFGPLDDATFTPPPAIQELVKQKK